MLAIAAPSFGSPSETFVRDHLRVVAPGETIFICNDPRGSEELALPTLSCFERWDQRFSLRDGAQGAMWHVWQRLIDPGLPQADRNRVVKFLRKYEPRALLAEYGNSGCLLAEACRVAEVPLYVHFHGHDVSVVLRSWYWVRSYRQLFRKVAGVICSSRFLAGKLLAIGCPEHLLHISPGGIDADRFVPTRRVAQRVVAVGRLVEKKAPHLTIESFGMIANRFPGARLDIVGDGPLAGQCNATIERLGLQGKVVMHGAKNSDFVAGLMGDASLFLQHSVTAKNGDTEGFGISLVEAMACEIPVIATRHNGFVDTVEDGVTGILVREYDVEAMAAEMSKLFEDPDRAAAMGVEGRKRVLCHFTHQRMRDRLRAIMRLPPSRSSSDRVV